MGGDHGVSATGTGRFDLLVCPCNTWNDFPQPCPYHGGSWTAPVVYPYVPPPVQMITWPPPEPQRLSDDDVKRIAREVVRQLARANHDPGDED
jgi:hypothetical protein